MIPSTSTAPDIDINSNNVTSTDAELEISDPLEEMMTKFWIAVICYVMCSVAWFAYCIISYRRNVEKVENQNRENKVSRYLELQRLLSAYDRIDVESARTATTVTPTAPEASP